MTTTALRYCALAVFLVLGLGEARALVPIEGLLQGSAAQDFQQDPMSLVFQNQSSSDEPARALHKLYIAHYAEAQGLQQSCDYIGTADYASPSEEERARRSVVAGLQYLGLDMTVKAIGQYARMLQMPPADYTKLVDNLVTSSCSPNVTVYGLKLIKQNLQSVYERNDLNVPSFPGMPYVSTKLTDKNNSLVTKEQELHHSMQNFRALCSWGGDTQNYRLLPPLLSNPLVMVTVLRHLENKLLMWDVKTQQARQVEGQGAIQVTCQNLICRRVENKEFVKTFPRLIGSSGIKQDLYRLWCNHFRMQETMGSDRQHPQVREWLKKIDPVHERQMVGQMVALMTGVPDIMVSTKQYTELRDDLRAGIDERWDNWAKRALTSFSKDLLYEESLEIKVRPRRDPATIRQNLFAVDLTVTMGELDRLLQTGDKLRLDLDLKVSRNWLRWLRTRWNTVNQEANPATLEAFMDEVALYLKPQIEGKAKYFPTPLFRDGLEHVLAQELVEQVLRYQGSLFDTYEDKMLDVPLRFHYGMFALSYMRYKAQIKARHKTLDL